MSSVKRDETTTLSGGRSSYGRSYGSTQRSVKEMFISHDVSPSDTLQGIALKYGVTVQDLRRVNKLYTNDSIFLRSVLYIPVGDQPLPASVLENTVSSTQGSPLNNPDHRKAAANNIESDNHDEEERETEESSANNDDPMDFLSRIDQQIKHRRNELMKVEKTSRIGEISAGMSSLSAIGPPLVDRCSDRASPVPGGAESYQLGTSNATVQQQRSEASDDHLDRRPGGSLSPLLGVVVESPESNQVYPSSTL